MPDKKKVERTFYFTDVDGKYELYTGDLSGGRARIGNELLSIGMQKALVKWLTTLIEHHEREGYLDSEDALQDVKEEKAGLIGVGTSTELEKRRKSKERD